MRDFKLPLLCRKIGASYAIRINSKLLQMRINQLNSNDKTPLWQVCSAVVQCAVEKTLGICAALNALPDTEVHAVNAEQGKIVVIMQGNSQKELANRMDAAREIDGVLTVLLVYHQIDENR